MCCWCSAPCRFTYHYLLACCVQAVGVARDDNHDSFWSAEDAQLRRSHPAKLADGDRGQLPLVKYVPQFNARSWRPPIDGLFPTAQPHQGTSRPSWFNRLSHRCRHSRRRSPRKNKVYTLIILPNYTAYEICSTSSVYRSNLLPDWVSRVQ